MQTKIVTMEGRRLVGLTVGGDPWNLPHAWERLHPLVRRHGLDSRALAWLSTFPTAGSPAEAARFGAALALPPETAGGPSCPEGLEEWDLPGGPTAVVVHFGSSEEIGATAARWEREWLPASSWEADPDRPRWEWYQNRNVPPELQLTFWCVPVRPRAG